MKVSKRNNVVIITAFIFISLLFGGLITTTTTKAQSVSTPSPLTPTPTATTTPTPTAKTPPPANEKSTTDEVAILKAQLEQMKFYDQKLLSTVYWSLGAVITLTILIAGFSWFTNFRLYERDKESLRREMSLEIDKFRSDVKVLFSEQKSSLSNSLENLVTEKFQEGFTDIDSKLDRLKTELTRNQINTNLLEAKIWTTKGVYKNAMTVYMSTLEEATRKDQSQYYSSILNGILEIVEKLDWITTHTMADLEKLFNALPKEQQISCDSIREKLKEKLK